MLIQACTPRPPQAWDFWVKTNKNGKNDKKIQNCKSKSH